jgi:hypothetical protein
VAGAVTLAERTHAAGLLDSARDAYLHAMSAVLLVCARSRSRGRPLSWCAAVPGPASRDLDAAPDLSPRRSGLKNGFMNTPGLRGAEEAEDALGDPGARAALFAEQGLRRHHDRTRSRGAEISPSTFFRYFPTKEDLVIATSTTTCSSRAAAASRPEVPPLRAVREVMGETLRQMGPEEQARVWERRG